MRSGRLRHRLQLQEQTETKDSHGAAIITWTTTATVWGGVEVFSGFESFKADQAQDMLQLRVVIRYGSEWAGIDPSWRVKDANTGRKYDIHAVVQPEHRSRPNTVIELQCTESKKDDE